MNKINLVEEIKERIQITERNKDLKQSRFFSFLLFQAFKKSELKSEEVEEILKALILSQYSLAEKREKDFILNYLKPFKEKIEND